MKESGDEGFLVLMGYTDRQNYQWYNIGGWNNTLNNVEQTDGGGKTTIARDKRFKVENNRWYDLQVDVEGDSIHCYIDGKLDFACKRQKNGNMEGVYATTTIDETQNIMYVKIVNVGEGSAPGTLNLKNCKADTTSPSAVTLTRLASANGTDENTLANPKAIYPHTTELKPATSGETIQFDVAPFSVNILKIKLK